MSQLSREHGYAAIPNGVYRARIMERPVALIVAIALLGLTAAFVGYQQIFSVLAPYDDEGYVMLSVAQYLRGLRLYEDIYTQYGPGLFIVEGGFHRLTGLPITHDVVRLRTLAMWMTSSLFAAGVVWLATSSRVASAIAFVLAFLHLERLCLEPGHPQEICVLLILIAIFLAAHLVTHTQRMWVALGLGVAVALVMMTKLNIGIFLLAGVTLTLLLAAPAGCGRNVALSLAAVLALALPLAITWGKHNAQDIRLPVTVLGGIAGVLIATLRLRPTTAESPLHEPAIPSVSWIRVGIFFLTGLIVGCGMLAGAMYVRGVSLPTLWYGLVSQHRDFADAFYHPAPLHAAVPVVAFAGVLAAIGISRTPSRVATLAQWIVAGMVAAVMVCYVAETTTPLVHGLNDRGGAGLLVSFVPPMAWGIISPWRRSGASPDSRIDYSAMSRLALCAVAVLQPLGAFPTPGTQMAVGSLPLLLVCVVALCDVAYQKSPGSVRCSLVRCGVPRMITAVLILATVTLTWRGVWLYQYRASLPPLGLRGASLLCVPAETAAEQQWLVAHLQSQADTFVFGEHARNSLYFWTGREPPTALNATVWPYLLTSEQQQRIVAALKTYSRAYLVRERYAAPPPQKEQPLAEYLTDAFHPQAKFGRFEIFNATRTSKIKQGRTDLSVPEG